MTSPPRGIEELGILMAARLQHAIRLQALESRVDTLETQILNLRSQLADLESSCEITLNTLAPEPYDLLSEVKIVVESAGEEFIASYMDANINAAGDSKEEALSNLKSLLIDVYEILYDEEDSRLGPGPLRQKRILATVMKKRS
jgi:predicted RNase H-like HicB family nuclease